MPGPRVYTLDEANELVPTLSEIFAAIDADRDRLRTIKIKLNALEMIWGSQLGQQDCPDHDEGRALLEQLNEIETSIGARVQRIGELGGLVKDVRGGLIDLYHVRDGVLVHLCWQRGEGEFVAWHHVDEGFAERESL